MADLVRLVVVVVDGEPDLRETIAEHLRTGGLIVTDDARGFAPSKP